MPHPNTPLTGLPLATVLFVAGLAPPGVFLAGGAYWYPHTLMGPVVWEPWCDIGAVWHLVERYELDITKGGTTWSVAHPDLASRNDEIGLVFADIPAAVGRLALRLRQAELAQEVQHAD